jgi:hypothetical protein
MAKIERMSGEERLVVLPEFRGYTVDARLREFRLVDRRKLCIEFVSFDSPKGQALLAVMRAEEG